MSFDQHFNLEIVGLFSWQTLLPQALFSAALILILFLEPSNMKNFASLTWDSNPNTVQALDVETTMIPLNYRGSFIYDRQSVESLVILSPTQLKNLCWFSSEFQPGPVILPGENLAEAFFSGGP